MIKHVKGGYEETLKGGYEETLKGVTKTFKWIDGRGYIEIPKCSLGKELDL